MRKFFEPVFLITLLLLPLYGEAQPRPIHLSMALPRARGAEGTLRSGGYTIVIQLRVQNAPIFVQEFAEEALVYEDPDGCIDMSHFLTLAPPVESCAGGPNEKFLRFRPAQRDDVPGRSQTCTPEVSARLVDDEFNSATILHLNKPYLIAGLGTRDGFTRGNLDLREVGPFTGGTAASGPSSEDCFGLSADDALPGLVLMADIGPMRVFDQHFNVVKPRIRNFAGMLNSVTTELQDQRDRSYVMGFLRVPDGLLEPLTLVDVITTKPGVDFRTRRDSGPVNSFRFTTPPTTPSEMRAAILATFPEFDVVVRAVIVEGQAPEFIEDLDHNGLYTARDVQLAGHTLISNQASLLIHAIQGDVLSREVPFRCAAAILAGDLDGDGLSGYSCETGNARSIRRPPP